VLHTAVNMADGSQQYYEETGTYILVIFLRFYCSYIFGSVKGHVAGFNLYYLS